MTEEAADNIVDLDDARNTPDTAPKQKTAIEHYRDIVTWCEEYEEELTAALSYAHGTHTFDDVVQGIITNRYVMIVLKESVIILEVLTYPRTQHMHIFLAGGNLDELVGYVPTLKELAKENGCSYLTLAGRKGWKAKLRQADKAWKELGGVPLGLPTGL